MSNRKFEKEPWFSHGMTVPRFVIRCQCGTTEALFDTNMGGRMKSDLIPKQFERKGWFVGTRTNGSKDKCPACVAAEQAERRSKLRVVKTEGDDPVNKPLLNVSANCLDRESPDIKVVAEPPREMTRQHRQIVFMKLTDVYADEKTGYASGWSDHKVAGDLGVPRAWVKTIREENFGPAHNVDTMNAVDKANSVVADIIKWRKEADGLVETAKALTNTATGLRQRADDVQRSLDKILHLLK